MPAYFDSKGTSYRINQPLGRGGEGTVFYCPEDLSIVAKIYHEPVDDDKAAKLRWMAANSNEQLLKVAAWIVDTLHDAPDGRVVGFLMPNVRAKEIHELYSLKSRRVHFPDATWQFLVHAAANVARAFHNLHRHGHVMGDVNHGNCVVLADGTVKLIDCDSYSIKTDDKRYRCEVGVATHLAPELQGIDLSEIEREPNHDNFGLAVIIFQLLFLGRHPFAGNYLGKEDKSLEDCIRERRFAYGNNQAITNVKQPPGTLSLSAVPTRIAMMFERAFLMEERPEPREWIEALEDLGNSLTQCAAHGGHYYYDQLKACPWCSIEERTGLMLFPFLGTQKGGSENSFDIFTVEKLLSTIELPGHLPALPSHSAGMATVPSEATVDGRKKIKKRHVNFLLWQFALVTVLTIVGGPGVGFFVGAIAMITFLVMSHNLDRPIRDDLESQLYDAQLAWKKLESDWSKLTKEDRLNEDYDLLRDRVEEHHEIRRQVRERMRRISDQVMSYKLDRHLAAHKIADANIRGVGTKIIKRSKDHGIVSALDVTREAVDLIDEFDDDERELLIDWREEIERKFEFDASAEIPETERNRNEMVFADRRRIVERDIERLLVTLRSKTELVAKKRSDIRMRAGQLSIKLSQAESDAETLGSSTPFVVIMVLLTALIPMLGAIFTGSPVNQGNSEVEVAKLHFPSHTSNGANDEFTDAEIAAMTVSERQRIASELYQRSLNLNLEAAEQKLRQALRFAPNDQLVIYDLGELLYALKRYDEGLRLLRRLNGGPTVPNRILLGKTLVATGNLIEAESILFEVYKSGSKSFDVCFYLGVVNEELKEYDTAITYLTEATRIAPDNVDAQFELAKSHAKKGDGKSAGVVYDILITKDPKKAEELKRIIDSK